MIVGTQKWSRRRYRRYVLPALIVAIWGVGCTGEGTQQADTGQTQASQGPGRGTQPSRPLVECGHDGAPSFAATGLATAGAYTSVPEYHDCQRFLSKSSGFTEYDSLQAVYVRYKLDLIYADTNYGRRPPGARGNIADMLLSPGFIEVFGQVGNAVLRVVSVGVIYSEGPYEDLGLTRTFTCVVLVWRSSDPQDGYLAVMIPVAAEADCPNETRLNFPGPNAVAGAPRAGSSQPGRVGGAQPPPRVPTILRVKATNPVGNVPAVARWDWDPVQRLYYIGLKCPTGWCEIHAKPNQFSSEDYDPEPLDFPLGAGKVIRVKGYYDEQYLSNVRGYENGKDGVFGTVFPVSNLEARTMDDYRNDKWMPVAYVVLVGDVADYYLYKGYGPVALNGNNRPGPRSRRYEVSLCFVPSPTGGTGLAADTLAAKAAKAKCKIPDKMESGTRKCKVDEKNDGKWYALVKSGAMRGRLFCVHNRPMPDGSNPPPVVRWRWSPKDETIWIPCPGACCEKEIDEDCDPETEDCEVYEDT